jgi:hypothetical protein
MNGAHLPEEEILLCDCFAVEASGFHFASNKRGQARPALPR